MPHFPTRTGPRKVRQSNAFGVGVFPERRRPELLHKMSGCHVVFSDSLSRGSSTPESMVSFLEIIISILLVCCMICQFDFQMLRIARFSGTIKCWHCFFLRTFTFKVENSITWLTPFNTLLKSRKISVCPSSFTN